MASTVLVVDDEVLVAEVLAAGLSDEGHTVLTATHGYHALSQLDERPEMDLVLSDLIMPKLDGAALFLAMQAHERHRTIPFIFMSTMPESYVRSLVTGHKAFLRKPFALSNVIALVAGVILAHPR